LIKSNSIWQRQEIKTKLKMFQVTENRPHNISYPASRGSVLR
jgi:hypothetical protein